MGEQVEAVVVDPASDWPLFAEKEEHTIIEKEEHIPIFTMIPTFTFLEYRHHHLSVCHLYSKRENFGNR